MTKDEMITILNYHGEISFNDATGQYSLHRKKGGVIVGSGSTTQQESLNYLYHDIKTMLWSWCEANEILKETLRELDTKERDKAERVPVSVISQQIFRLSAV